MSNRCFCPPLNPRPFSPIIVSNPFGISLILQLTDLIDTQETDLRILPRHDEIDELYQRTFEHADDKLRGDHHPEGDLTLDDSVAVSKIKNLLP